MADVNLKAGKYRNKAKFNGYNKGGKFQGEKVLFKPLNPDLATLTYRIGDVNQPDKVRRFLENIRTYARATFILDLDNVLDIPPGDYPVYEEPEEPQDRRDAIAMKKWEKSYDIFTKNSEKFKTDKAKLAGVITGQLHTSSLERIRGTAAGLAAMDGKDPKGIAEAVITTHMNPGDVDAESNLYKCSQGYNNIRMRDDEDLVEYRDRFEANVTAYRLAAEDAAEEGDEGNPVPKESIQALHFVRTISAAYGRYKDNVEKGILEKPATVQGVVDAARRFGKERYNGPQGNDRNGDDYRGDKKGGGGGDHHNNNRYKIMYANNNKKGKGRGYQRFTPPEKSRCAICKQPGHWKNECPDKDEVDNAVAEAKETGAKGVSFGNLKNGGESKRRT
jgi:hypothetical protein